ncbi:MAG: hypothetical protein ACI9F9_001598 [Candidatus Paceibacteria bacterium]|jgi:hypothetical protein
MRPITLALLILTTPFSSAIAGDAIGSEDGDAEAPRRRVVHPSEVSAILRGDSGSEGLDAAGQGGQIERGVPACSPFST